MATTNHPLCPICKALTITTPVRLETFTTRLLPLCRLSCCCAEARHTPLLAHPHTRAGCVGYLEVPDELD